MKYRTWSLSCEIIDDSGLVLDETNEALCLDSDTYTPCVSNEIWVTPGFFKVSVELYCTPGAVGLGSIGKDVYVGHV